MAPPDRPLQLSDAVGTLTARALDVRRRYAAWETVTYGHESSATDLVAGLVVDVGDLTRIAMAKVGVRQMDRFDVDRGAAFADTMDELEARLA